MKWRGIEKGRGISMKESKACPHCGVVLIREGVGMRFRLCGCGTLVRMMTEGETRAEWRGRTTAGGVQRAIVEISYKDLAELMGLPPSVKILNIGASMQSWGAGNVELVIESSEFPRTQYGDRLPTAVIEMETIPIHRFKGFIVRGEGD